MTEQEYLAAGRREECEDTEDVNAQVTFLSLCMNARKMAQMRAFWI